MTKKKIIKSNFKIGDSVKVKEEIISPDLNGMSLENWQGRVSEINRNSEQRLVYVLIHWDSITLNNIPIKLIKILTFVKFFQ